ncbi:MAG: VWA domain-containing protein [Acidobacteriota bacterium]
MRSHHRLLFLCVLAMAGVLVAATAAPRVQAQAKGRTRDVYVTITDKSGAPAKDVAITDLTIREDNQAREVLAVGPAKAPMRIALLVDNSQATQPMTNEVRVAVSGFINAIFKASPDSTMSLATFGDRPTPVQDFTNAASVLVRAAQKMFPMSGSGAYLTDAVLDAAKALRKDPGPRQMIVAFVNESGQEFSNSGRQQVLDAVRFANASLWVVALQDTMTNVDSQEARDRSALIGEGTAQSGGTTISLLNRLSLPAKMAELAGILASQLQVTYGRPEQIIPPKKIDIQLNRKDLKLTAPRWAGQ